MIRKADDCYEAACPPVVLHWRKRWPSVHRLAVRYPNVGRRWLTAYVVGRRDLTAGLRRRVQEARN